MNARRDVAWRDFCVLDAKITVCGEQSGSELESRSRSRHSNSPIEV
jgi:hypothetical protein